MIRWTLSAVFAVLPATAAMAHFVFIVPTADGSKARVILSEDLEPDGDVDAAVVADAKLFSRDLAGHESPAALSRTDHGYTVDAPGKETRVLHGTDVLGVKQRGDAEPFLLTYHPKTILGDAFEPKATLGDKITPIELVPTGKPGGIAFKVLTHGKPTPGVEVNLILPDGKRQKATTTAAGVTESFAQPGRYGAWVRYFEPAAGEAGGKKYQEIRHYGTLVCDVRGASAGVPSHYAPMPQAASSFGGVASGGWLYVYGGHVAPVHTYSTEAVSGRFNRLNLADGVTWEALPGGPKMQGMNLAGHGGKIYRVGGMQPRNAPGQPAENFSTAECARFDPATRSWESLPPLPEPRSSHDVAVVGDRLFVIGGWSMRGKEGNRWLGTALVMNLAAAKLEWKPMKQPFERRALIVAAHGGKIYVLGGFNEESEPIQQVVIFDPATGTWTGGADLPGRERNGFAPAACSADGRLYVSVADGSLYRLEEASQSWKKAASTTPRIVHRLVCDGSRILVVGGAAKGANLDLIEAVDVGSGQITTEAGAIERK